MKLAIISTHPIQYFSPWFRYLQMTAEKQKKCEKGDRSWEMGDGEGGKPEIEKRKAETNQSVISDLPSMKKPEGFEFEVFYAHRQTAKGQAGAGFGVEFEWDTPLLEGYPHRFLKNVSRRPSTDTFQGCDCPEVGNILIKEGFTHLLCIGWYTKVFWEAIWAAKKTGIKVLSRGDSQLGMQMSLVKRWIKEIVYRPMLRAFDAHLYVGRRNLEYLRHYGVPKDRLFFSPHFVDNQWWGANAERSRAGGGRREVERGQKAEKSVEFLFAGKFIPKKRVMDLLEAAAGVPEARIVRVGDGPLRSELEKRAAKPDLKGRVEFAGFKNQRELPAYLAGADCLVLPSDGTETWGLIVNEAMACGTPAIMSTACGCAPDLIDEGQTGYSFPLGDTHALADRLRLFIQNKDRDWASVVREKIAKYSMEKATEGLLSALACPN